MMTLAHLAVVALACLQVPDGQSRLLGRLVGEAGEPIADAEVLIEAWGSWSAQHAAPPVRDRHGNEVHGFIGATDREGRFELNVPTPSADAVSLKIRPDEYRRQVHVDFGLAGGRAPILPGVNDLGTLVSAPAAVVIGHVTDLDGKPLAGARVRPEPGATGSAHYPATRSGGDGSFQLGHLPIGTFALLVKARGYCSRSDVSITTVGGRPEGPIGIQLRPAPSLQGVVTSTRGQPLEGARVDASPRGSGYTARALTASDGSYQIWFDRHAGYDLEFKAPGYETLSAAYEPGDVELDAVLREAASVLFEVRDAVSGRPIESFGLRLQGEQPWDRRAIAIAAHANGIARVPVRGAQRGWQLESPGYAPQEGAFDAHDERVDVRLLRGSRVRGVITADGSPLAHAVVHLALDGAGRVPHYSPDFAGWWWSEEDISDLTGFVGRLRRVVTGPEGQFEFVDLATGTYRVVCESSDGRFIDLRQLSVGQATELDLGRLVLSTGARVYGTVTLNGEPAADVQVTLYSGYNHDVARARTDERGVYGLAGLHPAWYQIIFRHDDRSQTLECLIEGDAGIRVDADLR